MTLMHNVLAAASKAPAGELMRPTFVEGGGRAPAPACPED